MPLWSYCVPRRVKLWWVCRLVHQKLKKKKLLQVIDLHDELGTIYWPQKTIKIEWLPLWCITPCSQYKTPTIPAPNHPIPAPYQHQSNPYQYQNTPYQHQTTPYQHQSSPYHYILSTRLAEGIKYSFSMFLLVLSHSGACRTSTYSSLCTLKAVTHWCINL